MDGTELNLKIRSAIKAKLIDLGAYVDDELPDYIMVMVANKKTQEQMTEDLNLFLGNNTVKFTSWLTALLDKLYSITTESVTDSIPAPEKSEQSEESSEPLAATPAVIVQSPEKQPPTTAKESQPDSDKKKAEKPAATDGSRKRLSGGQISTTVKVSPPKKARTSSDSRQEKITPIDIPAVLEIELQPEKDLFEDEMENLQPSKLSSIWSRQSKVSTQSASASAKPKKPATSTKITMSTNDRRPEDSKKRSLTSAIGAVVKHSEAEEEEEEEEEYDPYRPAIGNVASVVKVSARKSKVPATWQADKSILMKAVTAAQDSIEKNKKTEKVVVKPESHSHQSSSSSSRRLKSAVHSRLGNRRSRTSPRGMRSDHDSRRDRSRNDRNIEVFAKSKDDEVFSRLKSKALSSVKKTGTTGRDEKSSESSNRTRDKREPKENREKKEQTKYSSNEAVLDLTMPEDSRLIEYENVDLKVYKATPISRPSDMSTLIESGAEQSDFTDAEDEDNRVVKRREPPERLRDRSSSPKFVVTLDGVDPDCIPSKDKLDSDSDSEMVELPSPIKQERNIVRVEPFPQQPMIQPITINLGETEEFGEEGDVPMKSVGDSAIRQRCKFWPSCKNDVCPYHHPLETCRNFPKCTFGEKCLYIHPNCKFDAVCTRPSCPFTHTMRRPRPAFAAPTLPVIVQPIKVPVFPRPYHPGFRPPRPASQHPSQVTCKFFPKCTNMECPFNHPTPCRFGIACNNKKKCQFSHPKLPSKDQLSWSKQPKVPSSPGFSPQSPGYVEPTNLSFLS